MESNGRSGGGGRTVEEYSMESNGRSGGGRRRVEEYLMNGEGGQVGDEPENRRRRVEVDNGVDSNNNGDMMIDNNYEDGGSQHDRLDLSLRLSLGPSPDRARQPVQEEPAVICDPHAVVRPVQIGPVRHQPPPQVVNGDVNASVNNAAPGENQMSQTGREFIRVPPDVVRPVQIGQAIVQQQPPPHMVNGVVNASANNGAPGQNQINQERINPVHRALAQQFGPQPVAETAPGAAAHHIAEASSVRAARGRRRATQSGHNGRKSPTIAPPYEWATEHRATVHPLQTLIARGITAISGDVQCKHCEQPSQLNFNLIEKFQQIKHFVVSERDAMRDRAPARWLHPTLPKCPSCEHENSLKPMIAEKKRNINWLFLLLGEMLGCCTLDQLKYLCKHTGNHRTGAKNRVLYLTYLALCKQLDPAGPFDW